MVYTINGKTFGDAEPFRVKKGDMVKLKLVNKGTEDHSMYLHGYFFQVLSYNENPLAAPP